MKNIKNIKFNTLTHKVHSYVIARSQVILACEQTSQAHSEGALICYLSVLLKACLQAKLLVEALVNKQITNN